MSESTNLPADPKTLANRLAEAQQRAQLLDGEGAQFLRMDKTGEWIYGADDTEVQEGSLWAINPGSFIEGYIAWGDGEVLGEEMAPMTGQPVVAANLPPVPDASRGWEKQIGFQIQCTNGEDKGLSCIFKTSSKGGLKAVRKLIGIVVQQIGADPQAIVPVVALANDSYKHKTYGKIFTPVFDIKSWVTMDGMAPPPRVTHEEATADDAEPAEAAAAEAETEETATDSVDDEAPARPRRRRPVAS